MIGAGFSYLRAQPWRNVEVLLRTPAAACATSRDCGKGPEFFLPDRLRTRSILSGGSPMTDVAYLCHNCGSVHEVESIRENLILDLRTAASYELPGQQGILDPRARYLRWRMTWGLAQALWPGYAHHPRLASGRRLVPGASPSDCLVPRRAATSGREANPQSLHLANRTGDCGRSSACQPIIAQSAW